MYSLSKNDLSALLLSARRTLPFFFRAPLCIFALFPFPSFTNCNPPTRDHSFPQFRRTPQFSLKTRGHFTRNAPPQTRAITAHKPHHLTRHHILEQLVVFPFAPKPLLLRGTICGSGSPLKFQIESDIKKRSFLRRYKGCSQNSLTKVSASSQITKKTSKE